jgi:hypothetical protein
MMLAQYVTAVATADGTARAVTGPQKYGDRWVVTGLSSTTTSASETKLTVYRGTDMPSARLAGTYSGNNDNASGDPIDVPSQDKLVFVWENATPGATCTCTISGDLYSERF